MMDARQMLSLTPQEFVDFLNQEGISRFYFVFDNRTQTLKSSHPQLQPVADFIQADTRDFMQHEGMFFQVTPHHKTIQGAFVHRTCRGQAAGGVRYWSYDNMEAYFRDGMRLAKGMTRKNALAGLWWGGGKGVMAKNPQIDLQDPEIRAYLYRQYGEFVSSLCGCYVTAEDVGTFVKDMAEVFTSTRFTICIPKVCGGSGNPSVPTARGVVSGMEAALAYIGAGDLEGKTVAVQGMGNVGGPLIGFLFEKKVKKIIACDINADQVQQVKSQWPDKDLQARVVSREDIGFLTEECHILSPNATGAVLNPETIPRIKARIVCGAANNQLEDADRDDRLLFERGIIYVPDFLANRMGIVGAANEQYGYVIDDPLIEQHLHKDWEHSIYQTTLRVLGESQSAKRPTASIAMVLADELSLQEHPIFGHRGQQIISSLVADEWHTI